MSGTYTTQMCIRDRGKPKNGPEEKFSLAPVAVRLSELLGKPVVFANDDNVAGENAKAAVAAMQDLSLIHISTPPLRRYDPPYSVSVLTERIKHPI